MGLDGTLHRISVIRSRLNVPIGLTCRIGRGGVASVAALIQVRQLEGLHRYHTNVHALLSLMYCRLTLRNACYLT